MKISNHIYFQFKNKNISFESNYTEFNCIYANDSHGSLKNLPRLITGIREERKNLKDKKPLTLLAGDDFAYENLYDKKIRDTRLLHLSNLVNLIKADFWTPGNHDFDNGKEIFANLIENSNFKVVSTNLNEYKEHDKLRKEGKLASSFVIEKDGEKYGIIGAFPIDNAHHIRDLGLGNIIKGTKPPDNTVGYGSFKFPDKPEFLEEKFNKTLDLIKVELDKFKAQKVNKVILLSHLGYKEEQRLTQDKRAVGIDIIIGGHSHEELHGIKTQESIEKGIHKLKSKTDKPNLFYSASNEPIILTQAGSNAEYFGKLKVLFDNKGVIVTDKKGFPIEAKNELIATKDFAPNQKIKNKIDKQTNKAYENYPLIGKLREDVFPDFSRKRENTFVTYTLDGIKDLLNKQGENIDITMSNSSMVRMGIEKGNHNEGTLSLPFTFDDKLVITKLSGRQIMLAIKEMIETGNKKGRHDILQLSSNVKYEMEEDQQGNLKLTKLSINGENLDVDKKFKPRIYYADPNDPMDKVYNVAYRDFLTRGSLSKMLELKMDWDYKEATTKDGKPLLISKGLSHYIKTFATDKNGEIKLEENFKEPNITVKQTEKGQQPTFKGLKLKITG